MRELLEPAREDTLDYESIFRALARVCHVQPSEMPRMTLSLALALLADEEGRDDPHRGNVPITSADQLAKIAALHGAQDED